jgi:hypothetical protein
MRALRFLNCLSFKLTVFLMILTCAAFSQSSVLGKNCDLAVVGATDTKSFLAFDQELRNAFRTQDAAKMATLVEYPLVIETNGGTDYLKDASSASLIYKARLKVVFTPAIRRAVLDQRTETIWCSEEGIMYGNGVVVEAIGHGFTIEYAIHEIHLPSDRKPGEVEFACTTKKHRVIVDIGADGSPRYRAWNKPHALAEAPELEISSGRIDCGGTGPCASCSWTFTNDTAEYVVSQPDGCYEDTHLPPKGSKGYLDVTTSIGSKKVEEHLWCF